jgi:DNA-binding Lrp family transcriptional regulator
MAKIWRKAIENELDEKDVELLNILADERKFTEDEIRDFAKKLKISAQEVKKRIEALRKKKILLKDKVSVIDPMKIWDGYYIVLVKASIVPPIISEYVKFPTGWRIENYLERMKRVEKKMGIRILRQAYCMQGTEWDILLIVSALSQSDYVEFMDELAKEGWIAKGWSMIPVELGENWIFDPIAVPPVKIFRERVKKIKLEK